MALLAMKKETLKRLKIHILWLFCASAMLYGLSILYFRSTGGFALSNIQSDYPNDPRWETHPLENSESELIASILSQKFSYLGKGCQCYAFASADGDYVIKFFKYQRMRPQKWISFFTFIPFVDSYYQQKIVSKRLKREGVFQSWRIAFDFLSEATGISYVHLNKTNHLAKTLSLIDKAGYEHKLWIDDYEFMLQKRAKMLCTEIDELMGKGSISEAENILTSLVEKILAGYRRGLADNDHALMQNTGVFKGQPIHIDVGQFVLEEEVKAPAFYKQELYTKTYKFRLWLRKRHPELCDRFDCYLQETLGEEFLTMKPLWRKRMEIFQK